MRVYVLLVHVMDWDSIWDDQDQISIILIILSFIVIELRRSVREGVIINLLVFLFRKFGTVYQCNDAKLCNFSDHHGFFPLPFFYGPLKTQVTFFLAGPTLYVFQVLLYIDSLFLCSAAQKIKYWKEWTTGNENLSTDP